MLYEGILLLLPNMIKSERGHIINISSVAGLVGINRLSDYCASKSALIGFNDALRAELSQYNNIHTSCLCPYFFRSDLSQESTVIHIHTYMYAFLSNI